MIFPAGLPNQSAYFGVRTRLDQDDYLEMSFKMTFERFVTGRDLDDSQLKKMNVMIFQFRDKPTPINAAQKAPTDTFEAYGLMIFVISPDNPSVDVTYRNAYYMTYRYFATSTTLNSNYFSVLFNEKCHLISIK